MCFCSKISHIRTKYGDFGIPSAMRKHATEKLRILIYFGSVGHIVLEHLSEASLGIIIFLEVYFLKLCRLQLVGYFIYLFSKRIELAI